MKIYEHKKERAVPCPCAPSPCREDFSHIKGDAEDFIFSFTDNKKHSEK